MFGSHLFAQKSARHHLALAKCHDDLSEHHKALAEQHSDGGNPLLGKLHNRMAKSHAEMSALHQARADAYDSIGGGGDGGDSDDQEELHDKYARSLRQSVSGATLRRGASPFDGIDPELEDMVKSW